MLLGFTASNFQEEIFGARQDRSIHEKICMWEKSGVFSGRSSGRIFSTATKKGKQRNHKFHSKETTMNLSM